MLRKATEEDLSAPGGAALPTAGQSAEDAAGWLQNVAGLENILVLEKPGAPAPDAGRRTGPVRPPHQGIWFSGLAAGQGASRWTACCPN